LPECDDPSEVMSLFCCRLQLAHIGTYALPRLRRWASHIAGCALVVPGGLRLGWPPHKPSILRSGLAFETHP
jgi:hypothetical protein